MVRWREYAPLCDPRRAFTVWQRAFDECDRKLSDPLVDAGGICFRAAVRITGASRSFEGISNFRERRVGVVCRGSRRWKLEAAGGFGDELGHADRVQMKVVEQSA